MDPSELGARPSRHRPRRRIRRTASPRVLLTPRNEENPYLPLLKRSLEDVGVRIEWLRVEVTGSQTCNALLLPVELVRERLRGFNIIHLQWAYNFAWLWTRRLPAVRRLPRWWFAFILWFAEAIGYRIVYTSHEPLPLSPVFDDDIAGRRPIFGRASGIITITEAAKRQLAGEFGVSPERLQVIPEGAPTVVGGITRDDARGRLGIARDTPLVVMFGRLDPYKGVDVLLRAVLELPGEIRLAVRLLGLAANEAFAERIEELLAAVCATGRDARWDRGAFSDEDLEVLLAAADLFAAPFQWISNSGSMRATMAHEVPVVVPDLPELADVPEDGVYRYDRTAPDGLREVLARALRARPEERAARVSAAREWVTGWTWHEVAVATASVYERALRGESMTGEVGGRVGEISSVRS